MSEVDPGATFSLRFVNAHYAPDVAASGEYLTDLAEGLAARGHRVHVVTGQAPYQLDRLVAPEEEMRNGVRVTRIRTPSTGRRGGLDRLRGYAGFFAAAAPVALGGSSVDLTVYLTTPPLLGVMGLAGHLTSRRPYGLWLMDLHPEAEVAHGMLDAEGLAARALTRIDEAVVRRAHLVAALGRCMADRVRPKLPSGVDPTLLPLWKDVDEIVPVSRSANPLAAEWGVGDRFVLMYSGNAGLGHRFEEVKALLRHYRGDNGMLTLFVGGGSRREELETFISDQRIDNARYLDYVPREQVRWTLPLADVHLVTLQPSWSGIAVPSKIFGILASGRPAAMVGPEHSEVARIIAESGAGRVIAPGGSQSTAELVEFIETVRRDPAAREEMGRRGRRTLEETYTLNAGLDRWEAALHRVLSG